jgi:hypothetical protein
VQFTDRQVCHDPFVTQQKNIPYLDRRKAETGTPERLCFPAFRFSPSPCIFHAARIWLAYSLDRLSTHPLARAITRCGKQQQLEPLALEHYESVTGQGVQAKAGQAWFDGDQIGDARTPGRCRTTCSTVSFWFHPSTTPLRVT